MDWKEKKLYTSNVGIIVLAVICTLLWGSAYPCIKLGYDILGIAADDIPSKLVFAGVRFFTAGIMTLVYGCIVKKKFIVLPHSYWGEVTLLSLVMTVLHYVFFYIGLAHTTGVKGAIVYAMSTFFAVLLAHIFYKNDRLNIQKAIGCFIGFLGIIIVNVSQGGMDASFSFMGEGAMLIAAAAFAVGNLQSKWLSNKVDSIAITGYQLTFGGFVLIVAGYIFHGKLGEMTMAGVLLLGYMALLSAVAFTIWTVLLQYNRMGKVTVYNFLVPIFGVILSGILLKEDFLTVTNVISLVCVCVGIFLVNRRSKNNMQTNS